MTLTPKTLPYKTGEYCNCCHRDRWASFPFSNHDFLVFGCHNNIRILSIDQGTYIGISIEGKKYCVFCIQTIIGLEDHYDAFFPKIVKNKKNLEECNKFVYYFMTTNISRNEQNIRRKEWVHYRAKHSYFPEQFIKKILGVGRKKDEWDGTFPSDQGCCNGCGGKCVKNTYWVAVEGFGCDLFCPKCHIHLNSKTGVSIPETEEYGEVWEDAEKRIFAQREASK